MTRILSPSVASHDKYNYPHKQESLNVLLQCPPSVHPWGWNRIPVHSAEIHEFGKYVKHTSSLAAASSLNLQVLT